MRRDGSTVWSLTTVTLLKDAAGQPQRFIGVIEDITSRRRAEAALREETRILELLNETGRTLASKLDMEGLTQTVTDAATQLSGARFGAFFANAKDENGDSFLLYTLAGAPREAFDKFSAHPGAILFGAMLRGEAPIRCEDLLTDPPTARRRLARACPADCSRCAAASPCPCGHGPARSSAGCSSATRKPACSRNDRNG